MKLCIECWNALFNEYEENEFEVTIGESTKTHDLLKEDSDFAVKEIPGQCQNCGANGYILDDYFICVSLCSKPAKDPAKDKIAQRKKVLHRKVKRRKLTHAEYVSIKNAVALLAFHRRSIDGDSREPEKQNEEIPQQKKPTRKVIPDSFLSLLHEIEKQKGDWELGD